MILSACGSSKSVIRSDNVNQTSIINNGSVDSSSNQSIDENNRNNNKGNPPIQVNKKIELNEKSYIVGNVKIKYPEIINLDDSFRQKELNELLKSDALKILEYYEGTSDRISLDIDYIIKWIGSSFISIQYLGSGYITDNAYPKNIVFTTNLDVKNGRKIRLSDIIKIDEHFIGLFKAGKYIPFDPDLNVESETKGELNSFTNAEIMVYLNNSDEISDENALNIYTYFNKDSIGASVAVPHALGDHVEFEIDYREFEDNIIIQNEIWNEFIAAPTIEGDL